MMKKLLFTITTTLLFNFAHSGYAAPDINGLNDLPDEIKLHIALQLPGDDQKNLAQTNKIFSTIMKDQVFLLQQTARKLGMNFDHIDKFLRDFLMDVTTGNLVIKMIKAPYNNMSHMFTDNNGYVRPEYWGKTIIDNNGEVSFMHYPNFDYGALAINSKIAINSMDPDKKIWVGSHSQLRQDVLEGSHYNDDEKQHQTVATKYMSDTKNAVDLLPFTNSFLVNGLTTEEKIFSSSAHSLNHDGSFVVGDVIIEDNAGSRTCRGFIHKNDSGPILLDKVEQYNSNSLTGVSDNGEVVVGSSINSNSFIFDERSATIWFQQSNNNKNLYHPCFLDDLIMYNCSEKQPTFLKYLHFRNVLALSPDGKKMLLSTMWNADTPNNVRKSNPNNPYVTVIFGSNIKSKMPDVTVTH